MQQEESKKVEDTSSPHSDLMALSSALAQEGVSRVASYISTELDDKASREHNIARLEMALSQLEFVLDKTGKKPITYISLIRRWNMFKCAYNEGVNLLGKHKLLALEGHEETGQVVVRSSSYLERIVSATRLFISSLAGFNKEHLSSSVVQEFEWYADWANKFIADVESACPLQRDTFFRYSFIRKVFEGKTFRYERMCGSQQLWFHIYPLISEGRGMEACLWYKYLDSERLDKSLDFGVILRLSESTDVVGIGINCLRSSASLLNLVAEDAMGELTLLSDLQENQYSYDLPGAASSRELYLISRSSRLDAVCCHANVHKSGAKDIISSELSHILPEQVIYFNLTCYIPAPDSFPRATNKAGRIRNLRMIDQPPPLQHKLILLPHYSHQPMQEECYILRTMGSEEDKRPYGSIHQNIDTVRSEAIDCLKRQPELTCYEVYWFTKHGAAWCKVAKPSTDISSASKASGRYNTRIAAKRKR